MIDLCMFWCSLFLIFYTYIGYYLLLVVLSKLNVPERKRDTNFTPSISVIIAAHNEEKIIEKKINNCLEINYPKDKITFFFGSDGSTDRTNDILNQSKNDIIKVYLFNERRGKATVLNELVKHARGEIVVFSDANTIYKPDSIRQLVQHFSDPKTGGICGKLILFSPNDDVSGQCETFYWDYENRLKYLEGKIKTVFGANGAIYAIRRKLYCNLPENKLIMDDFLIPLKIVEKGYDVIYEENAIGMEATSLYLKDEFSRKVRIGAANFNALKEIGPLLNPLRGYIALGLWSHKIVRWFVPFLLFILLISNIFISGTFYSVFLFCHVLFYLSVLFGWLLLKRNIKLIPFSYIYYFAVANFALLVGFFKFLRGTQKPAWTRVER